MPRTTRSLAKPCAWLLGCGVAIALAQAPATVPAAPAAPAPPDASAPRPAFGLPALKDLKLEVPRSIRGATNALGLGRQRLALVVGNALVGSRLVLDPAPRDAAAMAQALRNAGFVVMLREDQGAAALRADLKEFRERLQPGGLGFVYIAALAAQVQGQNLLVMRDTALDAEATAPTVAAALRRSALPLSEVIDALLGTPDSPRLLVVNGAYRHPALDKLPQPGLAEPRLPPGMMVMFDQALGNTHEVPSTAPLPVPPPSEPRELAASRFTQALVGALTTPRLSGPEALRSARRAMVEGSLGQWQPWLGGDTEDSEDFAAGGLLDGVLPQTPEDVAREVAKKGLQQAARTGSRAAGEQTVAEVLANNPSPTAATAPGTAVPQAATPADAARGGEGNSSAQRATRALADGASDTAGSSLGQAAGNAAGTAASTVASVAGSAAGVAATAATIAAGVTAAEALAVAEASAQAAGSAVSLLGSAVGNAAALAARGGGASEATAVQAAARTAQASSAGNASIQSAGRAAADGMASTAAAPVAQAAQVSQAATPLAQAAQAAQAVQVASALPSATPTTPTTATTAATQAARTAARLALDGRTLRTGEGGERPVYQPRTNHFGYAEGDTFTYSVTDTWKGEVTGRYTTAIEEVLSDGELLANGQQVAMDAEGRIKAQRGADGGRSVFEPVQELWWANPQRGQSRDLRFTERFERPGIGNGEAVWTGSASVGRLRKIELPAGEFEVLPIESSGWVREQIANGEAISTRWSRTVWYAPKLGHPVAIDIEDSDRLGKLLRRERVELLHVQSARSAR